MPDLVDAAGRAVAVLLAALARLRHAKPMHPQGVVFSALLDRRALGIGIDWLDETGTDEVVVRLSRGAGLPDRFPDLLGFALRLPGERPVDVLLSSAGQGRWARWLPVLRRDAATPYGSLMSYGSTAGRVRLVAVPQGGPLPSDRDGLTAAGPGRVFTLAAAVGGGPSQPFGTVTLGAATEPPDPPLHFDAVLNAPPGLRADGPLARFRRPAYAAARRAQGADLVAGSP
jgi:hypothetical protein